MEQVSVRPVAPQYVFVSRRNEADLQIFWYY